MRGAILCFVLGVASLQQMARLPDSGWQYAGGLALVLLIALRFWLKASKLGSDMAADQRSGFRINAVPCLNWLALACAGWLAGWLWALYCASLHAQNPLPEAWEQRELQVTGVISSLPVADQQAQHFQFKIEQLPAELAQSWQAPLEINLAWYGDQVCGHDLSQLAAGQRWNMPLKLKRPHGTQNPAGFDYELWLFERNLRASGYVATPKYQAACGKLKLLHEQVPGLGYMIERWRGALRQKILTALAGRDYAQVIVALVIGEQRAIPQAQWLLFNRSGIGHLISISGLHITMLASLAGVRAAAFWRDAARRRQDWTLRLPRQKLEALVAALTALGYTALAGFGIPAQRTLIMLLIYALSLFTGRNLAPSRVLAWALWLVVVLDPWAVLSAGFWLSFTAVGLLIYGDHRSARPDSQEVGARWQHVLRELRQAVRSQYLITIGMIPLSLLLFAQISLLSPIANALAIPVISLIVTPLALTASLLPGILSVWLLSLAHFLLAKLMWVLDGLAQFPLAIWIAPAPDILSFSLAILGILAILAPAGLGLRLPGLLCCLPMLLKQPVAPNPGEFRAQFIDVGQGMAVLIETAGHRLLYDGGPAYLNHSDAGARIIWPYLRQRGIRSVDLLMISHNDADHSGGMASLLRDVQINHLYSSLQPEQLTEKLAGVAPSAKLHHQTCLRGQSWVWDGIRFDVLHPDQQLLSTEKIKANPRSCVLRIGNGVDSLLLAGDIEAAQEQQLLTQVNPAMLKASVLLVPHHGSATSSTSAFVQAVQPRLAIFQQGYKNRYRHPNLRVWQRYGDFGVSRLRSDAQGAIQIDFGASLRYSAQRQLFPRYWHTDLTRLNPDSVVTEDGEPIQLSNFSATYE